MRVQFLSDKMQRDKEFFFLILVIVVVAYLMSRQPSPRALEPAQL